MANLHIIIVFCLFCLFNNALKHIFALDMWGFFCRIVIKLEGRKEMFYLTMHSTHFILRLYGVGHMVKDHSDSEKGNQLPPHRLFFPISSKGSFICTIPPTG